MSNECPALKILAAELRPVIGKHQRTPYINGDANLHYYSVRRDSDEAVSLSAYLIEHLANRHHAVWFANRVGMPGYINKR